MDNEIAQKLFGMKNLVIRLERIDSKNIRLHYGSEKMDTEKEPGLNRLFKARKFQCEECGHQLFNKPALRSHKLRKHGSKVHACPLCNKEFGILGELKTHTHVHIDERPFQCDKCDKAFKQKDTLERHVASIHSKVMASKPCDVCGKRFRTNFYLKKHKLLHLTIRDRHKKYECQLCSKKYFTSQNLTLHMSSHTNENYFRCSSCSWSCKTHRKLVLHTQIRHTNQKPTLVQIKCNECSIVVSSKDALDKHVKLKHCPDLQPFICAFCSKPFSTNGNLKQHEKRMHTHIDQRLFHCTFCPKSLKTRQNLQDHLRTHTNEKPFACPKCSYTSRVRTNLNKHIKLQHTRKPRDRPFICDICKKSFVFEYYLKQHKRKSHGSASSRVTCSSCNQKCHKYRLARHKLSMQCRLNGT